jgi:hypothetical protein
MGLQDRDYYRDYWKEKRTQEGRKQWRAVNPLRRGHRGLPRWFLFVVGCLAAYGFVAVCRDAGRLLRDLPL